MVSASRSCERCMAASAASRPKQFFNLIFISREPIEWCSSMIPCASSDRSIDGTIIGWMCQLYVCRFKFTIVPSTKRGYWKQSSRDHHVGPRTDNDSASVATELDRDEITVHGTTVVS